MNSDCCWLVWATEESCEEKSSKFDSLRAHTTSIKLASGGTFACCAAFALSFSGVTLFALCLQSICLANDMTGEMNDSSSGGIEKKTGNSGLF
jgi:hypothetical protein